MREKAVIVAYDMVTPYGAGADACWRGVLSRRTAISRITRFTTKAFQSEYAATVEGLSYHGEVSLVIQMLRRLFERAAGLIPRDAKLLLATTKGEIDLLEKSFLTGTGDAADCGLDRLARKVSALACVSDTGTVISAACASSSAATGRAAAMIKSGRADCVLVAACDAVSEFVFSGFSSLMALEPVAARPFDRDRKGLSLGEAAAFALLMSESRARREKREILGEIAGWGLSDDANHMTGPSRTGEGLVLAIRKAVKAAGISEGDVGLISAHGTGTVYNDAMELNAFRAVFGNSGVPCYSIKGGIGHTLGAAGLIETIMALKALREQKAPPTVNLKDVDDDARGWVSAEERPLGGRGRMALITNAGFSGINAALIVS